MAGMHSERGASSMKRALMVVQEAAKEAIQTPLEVGHGT